MISAINILKATCVMCGWHNMGDEPYETHRLKEFIAYLESTGGKVDDGGNYICHNCNEVSGDGE